MATPRQLCDEIQNDLRALSGLRHVTDPVDGITATPQIIVYVESGDYSSDVPGGMVGLLNIAVELHYPAVQLTQAYDLLIDYLPIVANALLKTIATTDGDQFNNTVDGIADQHIPFVLETYIKPDGATPMVRCRWTMRGLKQQTTIT